MDISSSLASYDTRTLQLLTSDLDVLSRGDVPLSPGACAADVLSSAKEGLFSADPMPTTLRQRPLLSKPSFLNKITTPGSALPPDGACARAMVTALPEEPQPRLQGRSKGQGEEEEASQCSLAPYPLFTSPVVRTPTGAKILACAFPQLELPAHVRIDSAPFFAAYYSSAALGSPLPYLCGERGRGMINDPLLDEWAFVLSQEEAKTEFYTGMDLKEDAPPQHGAAKASGLAGNRTLRPATRKREARVADISKATAVSAVAARSPSNAGATATALNNYSPRLKDQLSQVDIGRAGRHESSDEDGGTISDALIVSGMLMGSPTTAARTGQPSPRSFSAAQALAPPMYSTPLQGLDQTVSWSSSPPTVARRTRSQAGEPDLADGQHPARHDVDTASSTTAIDESLSWSHDGTQFYSDDDAMGSDSTGSMSHGDFWGQNTAFLDSWATGMDGGSDAGTAAAAASAARPQWNSGRRISEAAALDGLVPSAAFYLSNKEWARYFRERLVHLTEAQAKAVSRHRRRVKNRRYQEELRRKRTEHKSGRQRTQSHLSAETSQLARRVSQLNELLAVERERTRALEQRIAAMELGLVTPESAEVPSGGAAAAYPVSAARRASTASAQARSSPSDDETLRL